jgi:hypothetical protein
VLWTGDSHNYSKPNICSDGVPPYVARSPEEWFDPETGRTPRLKAYDDEPFIQSARIEKDAGGGWRRFSLTAGTARNWYFLVPEGAREFAVRAAAADKDDVVHFEVCAPDRTMALIYDNAGGKIVKVPDGLAGKIWHLRPDVGSATRIVAKAGPDCRYQEIRLTVDLKGVPGCLAPTWEQWFDPFRPVQSEKRR